METTELEQKQDLIEEKITKLSAQEEEKKEAKGNDHDNVQARKATLRAAMDIMDEEQKAKYVSKLKAMEDEVTAKALAELEPDEKDKEIAKLQARLKEPIINNLTDDKVIADKLSARTLAELENIQDIINTMPNKVQAATIPAATTEPTTTDLDSILEVNQ